jgi:hypothetical protein
LGASNPLTYNISDQLAWLLNLSGRAADAEPLSRAVVEFVRSQPEPAGLQLATSADTLGHILFNLRRFIDSEALFRESDEIWRKTRPHGARVGLLREYHDSCFGVCLVKLARFAEAEPLLLAAYDEIARWPGPTWERTEALDRLVDLYDSWHAAEPDKAYDAKAAEWRAKREEWSASTQPAAVNQPAPANDDGD